MTDRVEGLAQEEDVGRQPDRDDHGLDDDESPAAHEARDQIGDPGASRRFINQGVVDRVWYVARGTSKPPAFDSTVGSPRSYV
jgi:hypothetical protein